MAKTISYGDYLSLVGLYTLSASHYKAMKTIERAAASILEVEADYGYYGHVSDGIWEDEPDVDQMLDLMNITVEKEVTA